MNSFGRQEGGGFRRREGKLVSPVRRDYPLHPKKTPAARKREKKQGGRRNVTPPKVPPGKKREEEEEQKEDKMGCMKRGGEGRKKRMSMREKK